MRNTSEVQSDNFADSDKLTQSADGATKQAVTLI
jgi:hypothetical protein